MDLQLIGTVGGILVVVKLASALSEKIIWDWLKAGRNGKSHQPLKARDMTVTQEELDHHCDKNQAVCIKTLEPKFQLMASQAAKETVEEFGKHILPRLIKRDHSFDVLDKRVKNLEFKSIRKS